MVVGNKIKQLRELKNFTQEYMADKLGIAQSTYARFEKDETEITLSKLSKISDILEVKIEDLLKFNGGNLYIYGEYRGTHTGNYTECPIEMIDLYKDKIKLLEEKIQYQQEIINQLKK